MDDAHRRALAAPDDRPRTAGESPSGAGNRVGHQASLSDRKPQGHTRSARAMPIRRCRTRRSVLEQPKATGTARDGPRLRPRGDRQLEFGGAASGMPAVLRGRRGRRRDAGARDRGRQRLAPTDRAKASRLPLPLDGHPQRRQSRLRRRLQSGRRRIGRGIPAVPQSGHAADAGQPRSGRCAICGRSENERSASSASSWSMRTAMSRATPRARRPRGRWSGNSLGLDRLMPRSFRRTSSPNGRTTRRGPWIR